MPVVVHTFKNVYLQVDDTKYAVSSCLMVLRENSIPTVRVVIDPAHEAHLGSPGSFDSPDATPATLSLIIAWHERFQVWAVEKKTAIYNMDVLRKDDPETADAPKLEQTINLTDWVITGSGITGARASGGFALEVELQHPLAGIDHAPTGLFGFRSKMDFPPSLASGFSDIPDGIATTMTEYSKVSARGRQLDITACGTIPVDVDAVRAKLSRQIKRAADLLRQHLTWTATTYSDSYVHAWPVAWCWASSLDAIKAALCDYITGHPEATPWELISHRLCPEWGLCVVPTYWKPELELRPASPWAAHQIVLEEIDVEEIQFPGVDPNPVAGIVMPHQTLASAGGYSIHVTGADTEQFLASEIGYMPPKVVSSEAEFQGRVFSVSPPSWIRMAGLKQAAIDGHISGELKAEAQGKLATDANTSRDAVAETASTTPDIVEGVSKVRYAIYQAAKYTYMQKFRQQVQIQLRTRLLFTSAGSTLDGPGGDVAGGYVIPGHVVRLRDTGALSAGNAGPTAPTDVFDFYCTDVVHSIDCQGGTVSTQIGGRYVRPIDQFEGLAKSGDLNPLYAE